MATIKIQVAGAPFDSGNFFTIPPVDGGPIVNLYPDSIVANIDGGYLSDPPSFFPLIDGGTIPLAGTATYDPNKVYGPTDVYEIEVIIED